MLSHREPNSQTEGPNSNASASFAHSLSTAQTLSNLNMALNNLANNNGLTATGVDSNTLTMSAMETTSSQELAMLLDNHGGQHQPETRMAVAEQLVSLAQSSGQINHTDMEVQFENIKAEPAPAPAAHSPIYLNAVDYVGSVKKAYESNPKNYADFLEVLEKYHDKSLTIDQLVRTVMTLFQDQPDLLMGFKDFLPEAQGLLNRLVPPMMYLDYKSQPKAVAPVRPQTIIPTTLLQPVGDPNTQQQGMKNIHQILNNGHAAADFLTLVKERSQREPDMYQHLLAFLKKFQQDHSYQKLYFYISIILRYHPQLLQRFHKFLPTVPTETEFKEPRVISNAQPAELVVSPDFIEAKDFVLTVKHQAETDLSMYDRFIFALERYQRTGWTIDQVYSEVSLIFWNHPDALAGFKHFITTVPQQP